MRTKTTTVKLFLLFVIALNFFKQELKAQALFHQMSVTGSAIQAVENKKKRAAVALNFKTDDGQNYYVIASVYNEHPKTFTPVPLTTLSTTFNLGTTFILSTLVKWFKSPLENIDAATTYYLNPYIDGEIIKYHFSDKKTTYNIPDSIFAKIQIKYPSFNDTTVKSDTLYFLFDKQYIDANELKIILLPALSSRDFNPIPPKKVGN